MRPHACSGVEADLTARLNCPHCYKPVTHDHYRHFCSEPTVVETRRGHRRLLMAAIHTCKLKSTTAEALTAIYFLDAEGRHVDPGATDGDACGNLIDGLISRMPKGKPAKATLLALIRMGPPVGTDQGMVPKEVRSRGVPTGGTSKKHAYTPGTRRQTGHGSRHVGGPLPHDTPRRGGGG